MESNARWKAAELSWLAMACLAILFVSVCLRDTVMGTVSALTGVVCVVLTGKRSIHAYGFGLVNAVLYSIISYKAGLYGEVMLNSLYFVPMQFVGFFMWRAHMSEGAVTVRGMDAWQMGCTAAATTAAVVAYALVLHAMGDPQPIVDSFTTVLSVVAMLLSARRFKEQWILWIAIDVASVAMWYRAYSAGSEHVATLAMWCVYLLNAVYGALSWYRAKEENTRCLT